MGPRQSRVERRQARRCISRGKHGFRRSPLVYVSEHSLGEERFVIFRVSHRGRLLAVMYSERRRPGDNAEVIRIISAREATRGERIAYEEGTR